MRPKADRLGQNCGTMAESSTLEEVVKEFCSQLGLSELCEKVIAHAKNQIENQSVQSCDVNEEWIVCVIYITMIDARFVYGSLESQLLDSGSMPITVTDLLKTTNVRACEFLKRMKIMQDNSTLSNAVCQHLFLVQKKFLISCPLYKKFERMYADVFYGQSESPETLSQENKNNSKKYLCWLLFVTLKSIFQQQNECLKLVESFHLLLCCLEYTILTSHSNLYSSSGSVGYGSENETLTNLCLKYGANPDEVKYLRSYYFETEMISLASPEGIIDTSHLQDLYTTVHKQIGDINELDFLEDEYYLTTQRLQPQSAQSSPGGLEDTPVGQAMFKIQGLKNAFKITASHPSSELIQCFNDCSTNPQQLVSDLLQESEGTFVSAYGAATRRKGIGRSRFRTAMRVYYDVMEALVVEEKGRPTIGNISSLLNKATFHRSLLACSLELVLHTYECSTFPFANCFPTVPSRLATSHFAFPWILRVFGLESFDFFKLIDNLLQVKPELPSYLKEHLLKIEDQIVSDLGWESGSPVFAHVYTTTVVIGDSDVTQLRVVASNEKDSTQNIGSNDSLRKSQSTLVFLSKVLRRGLHNLKILSATLGIASTIVGKIGSCFEYCLQHRMSLFRDRHVDQILMCCIYGVPKIHDVEVKFKDIVTAYKNLDGCSPKLEKNVLIGDGERGPIILFYNKIFVPELKSYLFAINPGSQQQEHQSPLRDLNAAKRPENKGMPGKITINIASPFKVPMTPKTKTLYCFKDSPLSPLKLISRSGGQVKRGGASKKLKFTQSEMELN